MNARQRFRLLFLMLLLELAVWCAMTLDHAQKELERISFGMPKIQRQVARNLLPVPSESFRILKELFFKNQDSLKNWEEKIFKNRTLYRVIEEAGKSHLNARSKDASSGLFLKLDYDVTPSLYLTWHWRAHKFPHKKKPGDLSNRSQDDFAARLYVIFPGTNFFNSNVIEYIWDDKIPAGTFASSPFSGRVKLFVIRSGRAGAEQGGWRQEKRNIYEDYVALFGKKPERALGAIALMSDSDNTNTESEADFRDIQIKLKEPEGGEI